MQRLCQTNEAKKRSKADPGKRSDGCYSTAFPIMLPSTAGETFHRNHHSQ